MTRARRVSAFVPERCDPELLEQILVGREELLDDAVARIADGLDGGSKHNLLYVGPSGIGKTMFQSLVAHRLHESKRLGARLCLARLNEAEVSTSFLDFLLRVYRALRSSYAESFQGSRLESLHGLAEEQAQPVLEEALLKGLAGRLLVVQIEDLEGNFKALGSKGQNRLRAFLQERATTTLLATTPRLFEGISSREAPFFGFFQVEHLQPLSLEQTREFMDRLAHIRHNEPLLRSVQNESSQATLATLHHLCGGMPRSLLLCAATASSFEEARPLFSFCVNALTPYYRERLADLAFQKRRILALLARAEAPVPVKHLARELFMTHQTATALLKTLREAAWVESSARGRESLYELADPMMRYALGLVDEREEHMDSTLDFLQAWFRSDPAPAIVTDVWQDQRPEEVLAAIASSSSDPSQWASACRQILSRAERHAGLGSLGKALVTSLGGLGLVPELLNAWRDLWLELGQSQPGLWQALRLFVAAISWNENADEQALLGLFAHERSLLRAVREPG